MTLCRSCGITEHGTRADDNARTRRRFAEIPAAIPDYTLHHWEHLCRQCNWKYNRWCLRHEGRVEPEPRVLVNFLADRLRQLAERKRRNQPIIRCAAVTTYSRHRCSFFTAQNSDLCISHQRHEKLGTRIVRADTQDDWQWFRDMPQSIIATTIWTCEGCGKTVDRKPNWARLIWEDAWEGTDEKNFCWQCWSIMRKALEKAHKVSEQQQSNGGL